MLMHFTSSVTGCGFWTTQESIATIEPWEPSFPDGSGLIPNNTKTLLRLTCGIQLPVKEDVLDVVRQYEGK